MDIVLQNIGKNLWDADHHFSQTNDDNDLVVLSAFEASAVFRSYWATERLLAETEARARIFAEVVMTRFSTINAYKNLVSIYHDKVQELMWYVYPSC